ncbi:TetR/AcrR family transcriptional regulator [Nocardia terpenica]|uniref:TetR/AcrR family transcriptional regulator n=1 Tax=Nocardia terpenica TaxID=455432 RepID=UPI001895F145|nr:TetR/AcrR family transcriptional regulator [Nocardia terpenica]MBF6065827.1 TetR/AcrR family transcriptional regulator [Nocardia terpenica]MBF6108410.1 TetR/AcrR family transcriptional regulator [Nocardia terpenica]MBF6115942.1 TetR/AcrR family transcriptional regulator [Nocardia terpenica]MBF6123072.1 TetR/AcrR family transcriptional regulator [Nocardia terpenica]MBF6156254.1 TetR/AcrR family transcriptional regulator [Nocardia terpenica]
MSNAQPGTRTQQQRREAMVGRLIDAAIDTIVDHGYYRTSVSAVCDRAGVSAGALFRHFDTRLSLIARVAEEVSGRILAAYAAAGQHLREQPSPLRAGLAFLADAAETPLVAVWHEMMVAARTDDELRAMIEPAIQKFYNGIHTHTAEIGLLDAVPESAHELALFSMVHMFSGAALTGSVYPRPDLAAYRIPLAEHYVTHTPDLGDLSYDIEQ